MRQASFNSSGCILRVSILLVVVNHNHKGAFGSQSRPVPTVSGIYLSTQWTKEQRKGQKKKTDEVTAQVWWLFSGRDGTWTRSFSSHSTIFALDQVLATFFSFGGEGACSRELRSQHRLLSTRPVSLEPRSHFPSTVLPGSLLSTVWAKAPATKMPQKPLSALWAK